MRGVVYTPEELSVLCDAEYWCAERNDEARMAFEGRHDPLAEKINTWQEWRDERRGQLLLDEGDMLSYPKPPILVDDLMIAGTLTSLVSEPGLGKSFVALDLALSIASGQPTFLGFPLRISGPVVYVVGEGAGRFKLRLLGWRQHNGISGKLPFHWTNGPINLLDSGELDHFISEIRRIEPVLVIFDTFSRCLVGVEENSQAEMTKAVAALDKVRTCVDGMTVLVLHHLNASGTRERGSSVFRGAVDTQLKLSRPTRKKSQSDTADDIDDDPAPAQAIKLGTDKQKDLDTLSRPVVLHKCEFDLADEREESGVPSKSVVWLRHGKNTALVDRILAFVRGNTGPTKNGIVTHVGGKRKTVLDLIDGLEAEKRITVTQDGRQHRVYPVN